MVDVVQLVERQFVVLVVVGSSPIVHPIYIGISPSGKAPHFDCGTVGSNPAIPARFTSSVGRALDF